jgi:hypothetical protein
MGKTYSMYLTKGEDEIRLSNISSLQRQMVEDAFSGNGWDVTSTLIAKTEQPVPPVWRNAQEAYHALYGKQR